MLTPRHRTTLMLEPLTAAAFEPFGQVVEAGADPVTINDGFARRFDSSAVVDVARGDGTPRVSLYRARPRLLPLQLSLVERHLLGSQLFMPLSGAQYVVVVAAAGAAPSVESLRAFLVVAGQGVNLSAGTWHHPLLALDAADFFVLDRVGPGGAVDCEVHSLVDAEVWLDC